jgi:hypothetical protein
MKPVSGEPLKVPLLPKAPQSIKQGNGPLKSNQDGSKQKSNSLGIAKRVGYVATLGLGGIGHGVYLLGKKSKYKRNIENLQSKLEIEKHKSTLEPVNLKSLENKIAELQAKKKKVQKEMITAFSWGSSPYIGAAVNAAKFLKKKFTAKPAKPETQAAQFMKTL